MPLKLLTRMGEEPLPMVVREEESKNKVHALKAAGLVHALESEDHDELLVSLTEKGRRAIHARGPKGKPK